MPATRVDPPSIDRYSREAQEQFDAIRRELQGLVEESVRVQYFGPNAVEFKTHCGQLSEALARTLGRDLANMAGAVRAATSKITTSLGGREVVISVDPAPIVAPAVPPGDGSVELDPAALEALKPEVSRRTATITASLDSHFASLNRTDWQGPAKEMAVGDVRVVTTRAKGHVAEAERSIVQYIDRQLEVFTGG